MQSSIEILAPAGDAACLDAALAAGADAVYFGLDSGFNARARATNFAREDLPDIMQKIHDQGRRGYLTINTLVFDHELAAVQRVVSAAAEAGVDAAIVQDFGVARLIKRMVPTMRLHASTQMTCTDLAGIGLAAQLGVSRVTLARELSGAEIRDLARQTSIELEIFAHGALCISYSGQCLTSEAIGGRSANRGACAQACRLPFDLMVDGVKRELGNNAHLLSPKDLDASRIVPELLATGISAIKIEGRLKGPDYVAATTRLYRLALAAAQKSGPEPTELDHDFSTQFYSRGASLGFLHGVDHQALVDASHCDHIGIEIGTCIGAASFDQLTWLRLRTSRCLTLGDGILVQGGRAGENELGGRVWRIRHRGQEAKAIEACHEVWVWLGPDRKVVGDFSARRVFRTSSAALETEFKRLATEPCSKVLIRARLTGTLGERPSLRFSTSDNRRVEVRLEQPLTRAVTTPLEYSTIKEKLSRLGNTPYQLETLELELPEGVILPLSSLNRARREAADCLSAAARHGHSIDATVSLEDFLTWPERPSVQGGLFVTCRNLAQALAALDAGAAGVYLDFLAITGVGPAIRELRARHSATIGIALPRVRKPGEAKIDAYIRDLQPDALLLRSLGSLSDATDDPHPLGKSNDDSRPVLIADFSLNITNTLSALDCLRRNADAFTPSFDLDAAQLLALLNSPLGGYAEVVVHHALPLFHMEHCVIASLLSHGHDHRDCGRPCDHHEVSLLDRKGLLLPIEADVGCRNTVFHGVAQCAAEQVPVLRNSGVARFRIELVRETPTQTQALVVAYCNLLADRCSPDQVRRELRALGLPTVRGSLRVIG